MDFILPWREVLTMNGPLAQICALTCYGNAFLGGSQAPKYSLTHSTCQFCDSVQFVEVKKDWFGKTQEVKVASDVDEWFSSLHKRSATGIRLLCRPQNDPRITDRMSAGFVGGGGTWMMEVLLADGKSEFWAARWDVWNQNAPERKIWRVTYGRIATGVTQPDPMRRLEDVQEDFRTHLNAAHDFSARQDCGGFTQCFAEALRALENPGADIGYHKDLFPPGQLANPAVGMLKASMAAWVFGGMGSWNDMAFEGPAQKEYERVSENLFRAITEAIAVSASSSLPSKTSAAF